MTYNLRYPVEARELTAQTRQSIKDWCGECAWFYDNNGDSELYVQNNGPLASMADHVICAQSGSFIVKHPDEYFEVMTASDFNSKYVRC